MRKTISFVFCISVAFAQQSKLSLDKLWKNQYSPDRLESIRSLNNGTHYTVLEGNSTKVVSYEYAMLNKGTILINTENYQEINKISAYSFSKDESKLLIETLVDPIYRRSKQAVYWVYERATKTLQKVTEDKIQEPLFSPDALKIAYVFRRNLFIKELNSKLVYQITYDGDYQTLNGITDWVYEEEFGFVRAFDWSP